MTDVVKKLEVTTEELKALGAEIQKATDERVEAVEKKFSEAIDAIKAGRKFVGGGDEARIEGKKKTVEFLKALKRQDSAALKAMSEGVGSAGGFVVPEEFAAEINRVVEDFGLVRKLGRKLVMGSDTLNVPRLSSSVSVSYPGENTAGSASQPVIAQVQLLAKTIVGLTAMSNELLEDANVSIVDYLVELFAEAIAGEEDSQGLTGTGTPFTGILGDSGVTVVTAATGDDTFTEAATPDYCRDLISGVKPWALQGAGFVMHRTIWGVIQKKKTSSGGDYFASAANPVLSATAVSGFPTAIAGTLWGYPVYLSDKMPALSATAVSTKFVIFGNLKHLFVGVRSDMVMTVSDSATVGGESLFERNMSAVRVVARHAIAVGLPSAFACLKTSAS